MLEELCRTSFFEACKGVSHPLVRQHGMSSPFAHFYDGMLGLDYAPHNWSRVPLAKVTGAASNHDIRHTRHEAWLYFNDNAERLRNHYIRKQYGGDMKTAMLAAGTFDALFEGFYDYFEGRKHTFMAKTKKALEAKTNALAAVGKHPQSHGGVANLLKVLTKTMHDQGSSVYTIAKVQYAVCMQAGIYIPDEFLTDVLVAHEIIEEG